MSIQFKIVARKNPQNKEAAPKYYLEAKKRGTVAWEDLLEMAGEDLTIDKDEIRLAINRIFKKSEEMLRMGFTVNFGSLGHMEITLRSEGADTEKDATADKATDIVPHFIFGDALREAIKREKLERVAE